MEPKLLTANRFVDMRTEINYRYVVSDTEYFRPHYHDYFEVFLLLEGTAMHCINGTVRKLLPGSIVFIRPADVHDYYCDKGTSFSMLNITFTEKTFREMTVFLGEGFPAEKLSKASMPPEVRLTEHEFTRLIRKMTDIRAIDASDFATLKTSLRIFLFGIFTKYFSDYEAWDDTMPEWLNRLCEEMKRNGNFTLGSARMQELGGKSREHISRCLKKHTGLTVSEFVNDLRLKFIANMLRNSNHSISDIIYESGFNNLCHASRLFKEQYGMTMREYRNNPSVSF